MNQLCLDNVTKVILGEIETDELHNPEERLSQRCMVIISDGKEFQLILSGIDVRTNVEKGEPNETL